MGQHISLHFLAHCIVRSPIKPVLNPIECYMLFSSLLRWWWCNLPSRQKKGPLLHWTTNQKIVRALFFRNGLSKENSCNFSLLHSLGIIAFRKHYYTPDRTLQFSHTTVYLEVMLVESTAHQKVYMQKKLCTGLTGPHQR